MVEAPVPDRPNIHSNRVPWRLSDLNMYVFWTFKITWKASEETAPDARDHPLRLGASGRGAVTPRLMPPAFLLRHAEPRSTSLS